MDLTGYNWLGFWLALPKLANSPTGEQDSRGELKGAWTRAAVAWDLSTVHSPPMNGRRAAATDWVGSGFGFWRLVGRRDRLIWEETRDLLAALTHFGSLFLTIERTAEGFGHIIRHFM